MLGSSFARPRDVIDGRHADRDAYRTAVRSDAELLVRARHLLPEDVELVVTRAAAAYDAFRHLDDR